MEIERKFKLITTPELMRDIYNAGVTYAIHQIYLVITDTYSERIRHVLSTPSPKFSLTKKWGGPGMCRDEINITLSNSEYSLLAAKGIASLMKLRTSVSVPDYLKSIVNEIVIDVYDHTHALLEIEFKSEKEADEFISTNYLTDILPSIRTWIDVTNDSHYYNEQIALNGFPDD